MEPGKTWPLDMYSKMVDNKWVEQPPIEGRYCLYIRGTQLLVVCKSVAVETICLLNGGGAIEAHYSNQSMGLSVVHSHEKAKSKFKIRFTHSCGKSAEDNCLEAVDILSKYISVTEHASHKGRKPAEPVFKKMPQVIKDVLERNPELFKTSELVLHERHLAELVQECLLDPGIPSVVAKIEDLLENRFGDDV